MGVDPASTPDENGIASEAQVNSYEETPEYRNALIKLVDKYIQSPDLRAGRVHSAINNKKSFTQWDLLCFSALTLGGIASQQEWLAPLAKSLNKLVYLVHYDRALDIHEFSATQKAEFENDLRKLAETFSRNSRDSRSNEKSPGGSG